jgi:hypothetical protein
LYSLVDRKQYSAAVALKTQALFSSEEGFIVCRPSLPSRCVPSSTPHIPGIPTAQAVTSLHQLGALDAAGTLTSLGRQLAAFPMLQPAVARMLIAAASR